MMKITAILPTLFLSIFTLSLPMKAETLASEAASAADLQSAVLVELYTSRNCPACPGANERLVALSQTEDIFPLTWSVSYWDYLGGMDEFAKPEFEARQKSFANVFDLRGPYTPQAVVDGCAETSARRNQRKLLRKIASVRGQPKTDIGFDVTATSLSLTPTSEETPAMDVWLVGYIPGITEVRPDSGPNWKRTVSHVNMVTSLTHLSHWDGQSDMTHDFSCEEAACLILIEEEGNKEVVTFQTLPS